MNGDFDEIFGRPNQPPRQTFTERLGKANHTPRHTVTDDGVEVGIYKAYDVMPTTTITDICIVQSWVPGTDTPVRESFHYRYVHGVTCVGDTSVTIKLIGGVILIEGRNLAGLDEKIMRGKATIIQQFHPRVWPIPNENGPFIERIELVRADGGKRDG